MLALYFLHVLFALLHAYFLLNVVHKLPNHRVKLADSERLQPTNTILPTEHVSQNFPVWSMVCHNQR